MLTQFKVTLSSGLKRKKTLFKYVFLTQKMFLLLLSAPSRSATLLFVVAVTQLPL